MALPAGALTATVTVGAPIDISGAAGTLVSLTVRPDVPAGLVWAASGDMIEPWSAPGTAGTLTILADQPGMLTSSTVDGAARMVEIRSWPLVATWVTRQSAAGAQTRHVRHFSAPAPGATVDLDLLPQEGALPPAVITSAQTINIGAGSEEDIALAVDAYLTANPPAAPVTSVNGELGAVILDAADVGADPSGTAAAAVAAHEAALDPHPTYTTTDEAAAAAPVQSVAGRTGAVVIGSGDVTDFAEAVQDAVAAMLTSGTNVTLSYNDAAGTLSVTAAGGDAEVMRDTIGAALVGINGVTVTINDALDTITLAVTGLTIAQVTGLQSTLDGKAATGHTHAEMHTHANASALALVSGTNTGDQDLSGLAPASGQFPVLALTAAASVTLSADYPAQTLTMTQNTALVAPTPSAGHAIVFLLSGEFTPTWWAGIKWAGGAAPTYASAGTLYHLLYLGGAYWLASGQVHA